MTCPTLASSKLVTAGLRCKHPISVHKTIRAIKEVLIMEKELFRYVAGRARRSRHRRHGQPGHQGRGCCLEENAVAADSSDAAVEVATTKLLDFLEGRPTDWRRYRHSPRARQKEMMSEAAAKCSKHARAQGSGHKYCNCPSCAAASSCLQKFGASSFNTSHINYAESARVLPQRVRALLMHDGGMHCESASSKPIVGHCATGWPNLMKSSSVFLLAPYR